ncbi:MAG: DPP IV N-terminal domain-containing protein [Prevotella sp.]|nr:DPP IV N-terminal domain-containing protein [Prevotella sp.]
MNNIKCLTALSAFLFAFIPMNAQQKKLFTLEDLNFGGTNYHNLRPKTMQLAWWGDQLVHTDVEECNLVDPKTGKETLLFTLDDINKWAKSDDFHYVRHLQSATFPYPDQPIVAVGNKKAYTLIDFKKKQIVWQDSLSGQTANDWNPQSRATAYVEDNQLWVVDAESHKHQLTTDGSREIVYGQSVHRDEWGITKGTFWSPDGQRLAFYRMDQSMVTDYPQVSIDPRIAEMQPDKYPMAGTNTHVVTIGVYDLRTHKTLYLQTPPVQYAALPAQPDTPVFFTNLAWSPDGSTIYLQELNRDQNDCRLVSYDAATGQRLAELYRETSEKYVEPLHPIQFLPWDSTKFLLQSQKDGYNHLYLFDLSSSVGAGPVPARQLTSGLWVVLDVLGFNKKQKAVIIASNEKHPLQRNLYAVNIKTGNRTPLDNCEGVHRAVLSNSGTILYDKWQTPATPNTVSVTQFSNSKPQTTNILIAPDPWADYEQPMFESGKLKAADGTTDLYYRMVKPKDFNPAKKYPTVVYVYGGPHAHNVEASWHWYSRSWETYMAQKGYIVFILDNRGSENRGRDFEQATFRQLGQVEMKDQMKGVEFLKSLPYVDSNRLGVHGWSYGGYMTISLMTNYPDVFKVGVAGGPVIDWQWYEVMYGERYMDTPQQNPDGYAKCSLVNQAKNLKGKLQIIIGYNDPTVVPQHALSFIKACNEAGTQPDFYVYPGEGHNMMGHASVHLHERITQYFEDYLK